MHGARIGFFQGDIRHLSDDLNTLKPTVFPVVPRLLNRMYDKVGDCVRVGVELHWSATDGSDDPDYLLTMAPVSGWSIYDQSHILLGGWSQEGQLVDLQTGSWMPKVP